MTTEILRPNSNVNTLIDVYDYTNIDDNVTTGQAGDGLTCVFGRLNDNEQQRWGLTAPVEDFATVTSATVHLNSYDSESNSADQFLCRLLIGGAWTTATAIAIPAGSSAGWTSLTFNGSWTGSDFTAAQIELDGQAIGSSEEFQVDVLYVELDGTLAFSGFDYTGSGGLSIGGLAEDNLALAYDATGGLSLAGTSEAYPTLFYSGTGGLALAGASFLDVCPDAIACDSFSGDATSLATHYLDKVNNSSATQWSVINGTWTIESDELKINQEGTGILTVDVAQTDYAAELTYTVPTGTALMSQGFVIRYASGEYLRALYHATLNQLQIWTYESSTFTLRANQSKTLSGETTLELDVTGNQITITAEGTSCSYTSSLNNTASTIGITNIVVPASGTYTPTYFNQFTVFDNTVANIDATSTLSVSPGLIVRGIANCDATSSMAATADVIKLGIASSDSTSAVAATGNLISSNTAAIDGTSSLSATALVIHKGIASCDATSSISAQPTLIIDAGTSSCDATSSIEASGVVTKYGTASIDATSALSATGNLILGPIAGIDGTSAVDATGNLILGPTASTDTTSSMAVDPKLIVRSSADYDSTSSLEAYGNLISSNIAAIDSTSSLSAVPGRVIFGTSSCDATSSIEASGVVTKYGTASIDATSALSATANLIMGPIAAIDSTSNLAVTPKVIGLVSAACDAISSMTAAAKLTWRPTAASDATSALSVTSANLIRHIGCSISANSSIEIDPNVKISALANLDATSEINITPKVIGLNLASIDATSTLSVVPRIHTLGVSCAINGASSLSAAPNLVLRPTSAIIANSTFTINPTVVIDAEAVIEAISQLKLLGGFVPKNIIIELGKYLNAQSEITDIASQIHYGFRPDDTDLPAIVYLRINADHINEIDGLAGEVASRIDLVIYSYSYKTNRDLMKVLREKLSFFPDYLYSIQVADIDYGEPYDAIEYTEEGSARNIFRTTIPMEIWHNEDVTV